MTLNLSWESSAELFRIVSILFTFFLGFFVLKSNPKKSVNLIFFLGSFSISCWSLFDYLQDIFYPLLHHSYLYDVSMLFGISSVFSYIFLFHYFPNPKYIINTKWRIFLATIYIFVCGLVLTKKMYFNHGENIPQTVFEPTFIGSIYLNSTLIVFIYIFFIFILKWARHSTVQTRGQHIIVGTGLMITIIWLWVFNLSPLSFDQGRVFYHIGYSSFIALYVSIYVAIARKEIFNIKTVLHQKLFWLILNLFVLLPIVYLLSFIDISTVNQFNPFSSLNSILGIIQLLISILGISMGIFVLWQSKISIPTVLFF